MHGPRTQHKAYNARPTPTCLDPLVLVGVRSCRLSDAVATLEAQLKANPHGSMHPTLVANLANLYQMTGGPKSTLERLVMATAPDDFDPSVLHMGQVS